MNISCVKEIFVLLAVLATCSFGKQCSFPGANNPYEKCQVSEWLAWDCACCGTDVLRYNLAMRSKGICCPDEAGANVAMCKSECNITNVETAGKGLCGDFCFHKTELSPCSFMINEHTTSLGTGDATTNGGVLGDEGNKTRSNGEKVCYLVAWKITVYEENTIGTLSVYMKIRFKNVILSE